jgi:hypothetical protein
MNALILAAVLAAPAVTAPAAGAPASPVAAQAQAVLRPFQKSLKASLDESLTKGAPEAVDACHAVAPALTLAAQSKDVALGRTSRKLRNATNTPPAWTAALLDAPPKPGAQVVMPLGGKRYGYAEPIYLQAPCLVCHGEAVAPETKKALAAKYPNDQATGYKEGDFRGLFWVELTLK